jgi:release factor glutamine methyltransferase
MNYSQLFQYAKSEIKQVPLEYGDLDSHVFKMFEGVLHMPKQEILIHWNQEIPSQSLEKIDQILGLRLGGMPLQYVVGHEFFYNLKFSVGPGVLIPRPETECIVEYILSHFENTAVKIAELGSGSGNIAISILKERSNWLWDGYEINPESIPYLEQNLKEHKISNFKLHSGDFFELTKGLQDFDLVISNPPYIESPAILTLSQEVQKEPRLALDGGESGLDCIVKLIAHGQQILKKAGYLIFEIDPSQARTVQEILAQYSFTSCVIYKDYSGQDRFVVGKR